MTSDRTGRNLCLRPEFTIPVCLAHLESGQTLGRYAYGGSVFRQAVDGPTEFDQAGVEIIGASPSSEMDVECIGTALDALRNCGLVKMRVVFGDQAIFEALLGALDLPNAWRAKLGRAFGDSDKLSDDLRIITDGADEEFSNTSPQMQKALADKNIDEIRQLIEAKMRAGNLPASGGRTAAHIGERMMVKAELAASQLSDKQRQILNDFLHLEVPVGAAAEELRAFTHDAGLDLGREIDVFCARSDLLGELDGENTEIVWQAKFGRRLDYYTGIVFEVFGNEHPMTICGGGRYDHLMTMLGAGENTPAIGFSIRLDRLAEGKT